MRIFDSSKNKTWDGSGISVAKNNGAIIIGKNSSVKQSLFPTSSIATLKLYARKRTGSGPLSVKIINNDTELKTVELDVRSSTVSEFSIKIDNIDCNHAISIQLDRGPNAFGTLEITRVIIDSDNSSLKELRMFAADEAKKPKSRLINGKLDIADIVFNSTYSPCDGYGASAEWMVLALDRICNLSFNPIQISPDANSLAQPRTKELLNLASRGKSVISYHLPMPHNTQAYLDARKNNKPCISFTMFETTRVPSAWIKSINQNFDALFVPSSFCRDIFLSGGVNVPTYVIPLGIEPSMWPYRKRQADKPFTFIMFANATWGNTRKNYPATLAAFKDAFGNRKDVRLILKLTGGDAPNIKDSNNIKIISNVRYTHEQLLNLMYQADCMVFPSLGEGFGLTPREAMATGMPALVTNWSGMTPICSNGISYWVNPTSLQRAVGFDGLNHMNDGSGDYGEFAKISVSDLSERMKYIASNRDEAIACGEAAARWVRENETYDLTAIRILKAIKELSS